MRRTAPDVSLYYDCRSRSYGREEVKRMLSAHFGQRAQTDCFLQPPQTRRYPTQERLYYCGVEVLPDCSRIYASAFSFVHAPRYDRAEVKASHTSATAKIPAARGIYSPFSRRGYRCEGMAGWKRKLPVAIRPWSTWVLRSSPSGHLIAVGQVRLSPRTATTANPEVPHPCRDGMHFGPDGTLEHRKGSIEGLLKYLMERR